MDEVWYRYDDVRYAALLDEYERPCGPGVLEVKLREYKVIRHTPKGVWLAFSFGPLSAFSSAERRFVLNDARKRFACPTIEEAKQSFIARKTRQARIHHARAKQAEDSIKLINAGGEPCRLS